jgi:hypothetical protein
MLATVDYKSFQANLNAHIRGIIDTLRSNASRHGGEDKIKLKKLATELNDLEQAETKLIEAIEKGVLELDDRLKARVQQNKSRREAIAVEISVLQSKTQTPLQTLTPQKIEAAARVLNKRLLPLSP